MNLYRKDSNDEKFLAEVTISTSTPCDTIKLFNWPGFLLMSCDTSIADQQVTTAGSYFVDFVVRLPWSFKGELQRDRVVTYDRKTAALMGAAIIAACESEREAAQENFPSDLLAVPVSEVLQKLKNFPFNCALARLIVDNLEIDRPMNINIDSLKWTGSLAKKYLAALFAVQLLDSDDETDIFEIAQTAWLQKVKFRELTHNLIASSDGLLKEAIILPPVKVSRLIFVRVARTIIPIVVIIESDFRGDEKVLSGKEIAVQRAASTRAGSSSTIIASILACSRKGSYGFVREISG